MKVTILKRKLIHKSFKNIIHKSFSHHQMVLVVEFASISVAFLRINDTIQIKIPHSISNNQMQNEGESTSFSLVQSSRFRMGCAAMEGRRMIMQPILLLSCKKYLSLPMAIWLTGDCCIQEPRYFVAPQLTFYGSF